MEIVGNLNTVLFSVLPTPLQQVVLQLPLPGYSLVLVLVAAFAILLFVLVKPSQAAFDQFDDLLEDLPDEEEKRGPELKVKEPKKKKSQRGKGKGKDKRPGDEDKSQEAQLNEEVANDEADDWEQVTGRPKRKRE